MQHEGYWSGGGWQELAPEMYRRMSATTKPAVEQAGGTFLDLTGVFDAESGTTYGEDAVHYTPLGNEMLARALLPLVEQRLRAAGAQFVACWRLVCLFAVAVGSVGCAPDVRPQRAAEFADQLDQARQTLLADPSQGDAVCGTAESVSTGLEGVPGLSDLRPTYQQLVDATDALTAACGQLRLVTLPGRRVAGDGGGRPRSAGARRGAGPGADLPVPRRRRPVAQSSPTELHVLAAPRRRRTVSVTIRRV